MSALTGYPKPSTCPISLQEFLNIGLSENPYSEYQKLREERDFIQISSSDRSVRTFLALGYETCEAVIKGENFSSKTIGRLRPTSTSLFDEATFPASFADIRQRQVLDLEGQNHQTIRSFFDGIFNARAARELEGAMRQIAEEILDTALSKDNTRIDLATDFARIFPLRVIAHALRINPIDDLISEQDIATLATANGLLPTPEAFSSASLIASRFTQAIFDNSQSGGPFSEWFKKWAEVDPTDPRLLVSNLMFYMVAGFETSSNAICNLFKAMLDHPDTIDQVRACNISTVNLVREGLRYDPSVQCVVRAVRAAHNFRGVELQPGDIVTAVIGSANRDGRKFKDPDQFDPNSGAGYGLAFGAGKHLCHGVHHALLQIRIAQEVLFDRLKEFSFIPDEPPVRKQVLNLRGFTSFPLQIVTR